MFALVYKMLHCTLGHVDWPSIATLEEDKKTKEQYAAEMEVSVDPCIDHELHLNQSAHRVYCISVGCHIHRPRRSGRLLSPSSLMDAFRQAFSAQCRCLPYHSARLGTKSKAHQVRLWEEEESLARSDLLDQ